MGSGIAQVCAYHGLKVHLKEAQPELLEPALERIRQGLEKGAKAAGGDAEIARQALARIEPTTEWEDLKGVDMVIEAVFEQFEAKREVFEKLDRICASDVILASNTSSIPITRLGATTQRPARVVGMHFMNPVPRMKLVEVIRGLLTSAETIEETKALALRLEKVPIEVRDSPGFVSNRILIPMLNEAAFVLMEGVAEAEEIDQVLKLGMNHPMGPLELADLIGLDICLDIMEVLYDSFKDSKYRPCPLLRQMVDGGWLGRKSGRGFYDYTS
jgi:3-hydroxybutyryl-CoA dehydrogenase